RTHTSPALGTGASSARSSARPGATYQRALPCIFIPGREGVRGYLQTDWRRPHAPISSKRLKRHARPHSMLERSPRDEIAVASPTTVPAWRPVAFFAAVGLTIAGLVWLAVIALSPGGFGWVDLVLVVLFAVTLPWYVIGFWNAAIGLAIMRFAPDPVAAVTP